MYSINTYPYSVGQYLSTLIFATLLWVVAINLIRYFLKLLLTYHGWMYEMHGKLSLRTKLWLVSAVLHIGRSADSVRLALVVHFKVFLLHAVLHIGRSADSVRLALVVHFKVQAALEGACRPLC